MEGLGIVPATLLAQVINFVVLFGVLTFLAYKPILKMFDERSKKIKESIDQTEQIKLQAARAPQLPHRSVSPVA